jgi:hypothetical protein
MHLVLRQRRAEGISICIVEEEPQVFALPLGWSGQGDGVGFSHPYGLRTAAFFPT